MISAGPMIVELYLSCVAVAGLLMVQVILMRRDPWDTINRRFLFAIRVTAALFIGRILIIATGIAAFRIIILLAAALIPLAVLLLTEGLLRRHAPSLIKGVIAGGAVVFGLLSFWYAGSIDPARLAGLLLFQMVGYGCAAWLILLRDKSSLTLSENRVVTRLGLSLLVLAPASLSDFLFQWWGVPVQLSALAVLILCWLAIGLAKPGDGHRVSMLSIGVIIAAALLLGQVLAVLLQADLDGRLMLLALVFATLLSVVIFNDLRGILAEEHSLSILRHMATAPVMDAMAFLRDLQSHPLVEGAAIVSLDDLRDLDPAVLKGIFKTAPVLRKSAPPALDPEAEEHVTHLFDRYAATHIMLVSEQPRLLIALSMPSLSSSPSLEMELQVLQRFSFLISQVQETHHD